MIQRMIQHPWGWASLAPLACAVHCAATPLLVMTAPALAPGPIVEWALLAVTILVVVLALRPALRDHGNPAPFLFMGTGLLIWTASLLHLFHPLPEDLVTIPATLIVAGGFVWNSRLHCGSRKVHCAACETEATAPGTAPATPFREARLAGDSSGPAS